MGKDEGVGGRFEYPLESPGPAICQKMVSCAPDHSTNPPHNEGDVCEQFNTQLGLLLLLSSLPTSVLASIKAT